MKKMLLVAALVVAATAAIAQEKSRMVITRAWEKDGIKCGCVVEEVSAIVLNDSVAIVNGDTIEYSNLQSRTYNGSPIWKCSWYRGEEGGVLYDASTRESELEDPNKNIVSVEWVASETK